MDGTFMDLTLFIAVADFSMLANPRIPISAKGDLEQFNAQ